MVNYPISKIYIEGVDAPQDIDPIGFANALYRGLTAENFIKLHDCLTALRESSVTYLGELVGERRSDG